jgi:hypothetical protein
MSIRDTLQELELRRIYATAKTLDQLSLIAVLSEVFKHARGDFDLFQSTAVVAAPSTTTDILLEPPPGSQDEFEYIYIVMVDSNAVDVAGDLINFYVEDAISNYGVPLNVQTQPGNVNGIGAAVSFPSTQGEAVGKHPLYLRTKRNPANESWKRVKCRWRASGTVGNRNITVRGILLRRNP